MTGWVLETKIFLGRGVFSGGTGSWDRAGSWDGEGGRDGMASWDGEAGRDRMASWDEVGNRDEAAGLAGRVSGPNQVSSQPAKRRPWRCIGDSTKRWDSQHRTSSMARNTPTIRSCCGNGCGPWVIESRRNTSTISGCSR